MSKPENEVDTLQSTSDRGFISTAYKELNRVKETNGSIENCTRVLHGEFLVAEREIARNYYILKSLHHPIQ